MAFARGTVSRVRRKDEGKICKARFSVRNATCRRASASAVAIAATATDKKASAFVWMGNTIAPIAGKHAKYAWWKPMTDERVRVVFRVDREPGLFGVLRSAVEFQASQAGLDAQTCVEFARAAHDVCHETLSKLTNAEGGIEVTLDTFPDRIEMAIHCQGQQMPAIGLESFAFGDVVAGRAGGLNGLELLSRVDRVLYNTDDGVARTTLVKYLQPKR